MPTLVRAEASIVVVEDPLVGRLVHRLLDQHGYTVHEESPEAALHLLRGPMPVVSLIVTNTPGLFLPFADQVRLLYMAACPDYQLAKRFPVCRVIQKPFHPDELVSAVEALMNSEPQYLQ